MRVLRSAALVFFVVIAPAVSCGGAADSDLFAGDDAGTSNGDAPNATDSPGADDRTMHHDTSPGDDSPAGDDAAPDATNHDPGIRCGSVGPCDPVKQVCCRRGAAGAYEYDCSSATACANAGGVTLAIECDDQQDCATQGKHNDVCCVTADATGTATTVTCRPPTECNGTSSTWVCDPNDPNACPSGKMCTASTQTLPGYDICVQ